MKNSKIGKLIVETGNKYKSKIIKALNTSKKGLSQGNNSYSPLDKCRKTFLASLVYNFFVINVLVISCIKHNGYVSILITLLFIGLICSCVTFFASGQIYSMMHDGKLLEMDGVVTKKYRVNVFKNGIIGVKGDDNNFYEFMLESDVKVKKKRKYRFFYYQRDDNLIVTNVNYIGKVETDSE